MSSAFESANLSHAYILCNGPSLRGFDFARELIGKTTFGMNAAYRHWDRINWYPTYYSCLDVAVGMSHKEEIGRLIREASINGIKRFLLRRNLVDELGETEAPVDCLEDLFEKYPAIFHSRRITTGSHTLLWAAWLGYKNIFLLGADASYVEKIGESSPAGGLRLRLTQTPAHNPNYFFDDYQRAGDVYHIPNPGADKGDMVHIESWNTIRPALDLLDAIVVNANPASGITAFPKTLFQNAWNTMGEIRNKKVEHGNRFSDVDGFSRADDVQIDELKILYPFLPEKAGLMIDVGAHNGESFLRFQRRGWTIHAFEPDPERFAGLQEKIRSLERITLDSRAVSRVSGRQYPWFTTPDSDYAGTMHPFADTHVQTGIVTTVALSDIVRERGIEHIDLLKIDAEGFDFMVLQGFPFERLRPDFILCEFEDKKTVPLGCTTAEIAEMLRKEGYTVYVSEWHPVIRYGIRHQWHGFRPWPSPLNNPDAWGNLLAFAKEPDERVLLESVRQAIHKD